MLCAIPRLRQIVSSRPWDRFSYSLASSDAALAAIIFGRFVLTFPSALCTNCLRPTVLPSRTVVVAQLVERSLPTPEIHSSNPNIGKLYLSMVHWKDENKEKEAGNGPLKKQRPGHSPSQRANRLAFYLWMGVVARLLRLLRPHVSNGM